MIQEDNGYLHFNATITQNTSVYQNIWVTRYSDWYVIANVA